jgi:hypothetical protein
VFSSLFAPLLRFLFVLPSLFSSPVIKTEPSPSYPESEEDLEKLRKQLAEFSEKEAKEGKQNEFEDDGTLLLCLWFVVQPFLTSPFVLFSLALSLTDITEQELDQLRDESFISLEDVLPDGYITAYVPSRLFLSLPCSFSIARCSINFFFSFSLFVQKVVSKL